MPPGKKKLIYLFEYEGQFIEFDVKVMKLKSDEVDFIKKDIIIDTVKHEARRYISDSYDLREVYGCIKIDED